MADRYTMCESCKGGSDESWLTDGRSGGDVASICGCCMGLFGQRSADDLIAKIKSEIASANSIVDTRNKFTVNVKWTCPPILEVTRAISTYHISKGIDGKIDANSGSAFVKNGNSSKQKPIESYVLSSVRRLVRSIYPMAYMVDSADADVTLDIKSNIANQARICEIFVPNSSFSLKKKRRFVSESSTTDAVPGSDESDEVDSYDDVAQHDADRAISTIKKIAQELFSAYLDQFISRFCVDSNTSISWVVRKALKPIYLMGRYNKFARDVPQAPWSIGTDEAMSSNNSNNSSNNNSNKNNSDTHNDETAEAPSASQVGLDDLAGGDELFRRKGRFSVEEIVADAVKHYMGAQSCRLHGCGREDIDVRCLGNGRPFVLEVKDYTTDASSDVLNSIVRSIQEKRGLNIRGDLDIKYLKKVDKTVWETMQTIAEQKKKRYSCVVWSETPITRDTLRALEEMSSEHSGIDVDEDGMRGIKSDQKTPLRVLHRRSLMTRVKFFYDIQTAMLNDHYFIMTMVTSPGAYVKEFVHGDCGRTSPSLASLINSTQAQILQLDVSGIFDEFEGGMVHRGIARTPHLGAMLSSSSSSPLVSSSSNSQDSGGNISQINQKEAEDASWERLKSVKLPKYC